VSIARILNVDDNDSGRYVKSRVLKQAGYDVVEARTGVEALERARRDQPDLVLLDVKLPDINGHEVCRLIKRQTPHMLVLQISASFVAPVDRATGLDSGADAYLSQPVEPSELSATIRALLRLRRAEQSARESNELYRVIVQAALDYAIVTADLEGRVLTWSNGAQQVLGWTATQMTGESLDRLYVPEDVENGVPVRDRTRAAEESGTMADRWHLRHDGTRLWATTTMAPLRAHASDITGYVFMLRDRTAEKTERDAMDRTNVWLEREVAARTSALTAANRQLRHEIEERGRAEQALRQAQKMEAVGQLTGGIAHDFNNMLTVVLGSTEQLKKNLLPGDRAQHRRADLVMQAAEQAAALTHRLLAFSRLQPLDPKPTGLNALIGGLIDMVRRTIGETVQLRTDLEADLPAVLVDGNQLENAIVNLAVNARDAMLGGGTLTVSTRAEPAHVLLAVSDTGIGMSPETARRALEPFFTTKRSGQGTGLGLSQVYGFVRQSGGSLEISSAEGQGTTVELRFPRLPEGTAIDRNTGRNETPEFDGAGLSVLLVEDQDGVREHIAETLRDMGFDVATVSDAPAARRHLQAHPHIDLMVSDIGLPGGTDGWTLAAQVRRLVPGVKIVLMTGYAQPNTDPLDANTELLMKPFTRHAMLARLSRLLSSSWPPPISSTQ
jgi:PAS domain S-box-containing protein